MNGHIFTFFVMVVAAAEAAVGLAIILTVFKNRGDAEHRRRQFDEELRARTCNSGSFRHFRSRAS